MPSKDRASNTPLDKMGGEGEALAYVLMVSALDHETTIG